MKLQGIGYSLPFPLKSIKDCFQQLRGHMTDKTPQPRRKAAIIIGSVAGLLASAWLVVIQVDDARSRENMQALKNMSRMISGAEDSLPIEFTDVTEAVQDRHSSRLDAVALVKLTDSRVLLCEQARGFVHRSMRAGKIDYPERLGKTITARKYLPKPAAVICDFALEVITNPSEFVDDAAS